MIWDVKFSTGSVDRPKICPLSVHIGGGAGAVEANGMWTSTASTKGLIENQRNACTEDIKIQNFVSV